MSSPRIIQSLWTWPTRARGSRQLIGSWQQKSYHFMSWAYSCLLLRRHYEHVELYTDTWGKHLLIDKLRLPYTAVHVVLDEVTAPSPALWARGKLSVIAMQEAPFLHLDGDVFAFAPFGESLENAPIAVQHLEENYPYYSPGIRYMQEHFGYLPEVMKTHWEEVAGVYNAYNCGIVGGQDLAFMKQFALEALRLIEENAGAIKPGAPELNIIYEQHLLYCLAKQEGAEVNCYRSNIPASHEGLTSLQGAPRRNTYVHPVASYKKSPSFCLDLKNRLQREYPEYYYRIQHLAADFALI